MGDETNRSGCRTLFENYTLMVEKTFKVIVESGQAAEAVQVELFVELGDAVSKLGFRGKSPSLVLVGGASQISEEDFARLQELFVGVLAPLAEKLGATVVDGGTDAGIMRLMGQARAHIGGNFPLVGVAAIGTVCVPEVAISKIGGTKLEPNHTHFILVPGSRWGDESPWLAGAVRFFANGAPSVTLVINGGEITWLDVSQSVREGRATVVLEGSGRTADKLAAALRGEPTDERAENIVKSGLLQAIDMKRDTKAIAELLEKMLSPQSKERAQEH